MCLAIRCNRGVRPNKSILPHLKKLSNRPLSSYRPSEACETPFIAVSYELRHGDGASSLILNLLSRNFAYASKNAIQFGGFFLSLSDTRILLPHIATHVSIEYVVG